MATVPKSFKQMCPSCEAMVPVRDPQLIGKKIDCPKCKYRFVVEEPEEADVEETPKKKKGGDKVTDKPGKGGKTPVKGKTSPRKGDDDDDRPAKKGEKKGGSNMMLILGIGLALVAVVAIGVGIFAFLSGGEAKQANNNPGGPGPGGGMPGGNQPEEKKDNPAPPAPTEAVNATNLLPNDTQVVVSYPMDRTLGSTLQTAGLTNEGGFRQTTLSQQLGVPTGLQGEVTRVITASSEKDGWVYTIVRTKNPVKQDAVKTGLKLTPHSTRFKGKSGKMHEVFIINAELDGLGTLLLKGNKDKEQFAAYFHDDKHTLICADLAPLQKFLEGDGQFDYKTQPPLPPVAGGGGNTPPGQGGMAGGPPPGGALGGPGAGQLPPPGQGMAGGPPPAPGGMGGGPPPAPGGMGGGPPPAPGGMGGGPPAGALGGPGAGQLPPPGMGMGGGMAGGPPPGPGGGTTTPPSAPVAANWLTVDPSLKLILDRIEKEEENKDTRKKESASCLSVAYDYSNADVKKNFTLFGSDLLDLAVNSIPPLKNQAALTLMLPAFKREIKHVGFAIVALDQSTLNFVVAAEMKASRDSQRNEKLIRGELSKELATYKPHKLSFALSGAQPANQGFNGGMAGFGGGMLGGPPGMGGPPPGMGGPPPRPGAMGGMGGGGAPPPPGPPPAPGGMGGAFGGPPFGGGNPGNPGQPPDDDEKKDGHLTLSFEDKLLILNAEIKLNDAAYKAIVAQLDAQVASLKGQGDLLSKRPWVHHLGTALRLYADAKGAFPSGTLPRGSADRAVPWRPDQRRSFYAELVPYLGEEYRDWNTARDEGWNEGRNLAVAQRVVPHLVGVKQDKPVPVAVTYPGTEATVANCTFVGVAGVGLDAAEYAPGDAAAAKKRGVFSYDHATRKEEVTDGLGQTIALLMVPGDRPTPWLAGGGSTVRGVSETDDDGNPLEPFVCTTFPSKQDKKSPFDGKRGTLAVMGDGKVRFIPADMPAATFRALCTIAGGEKIDRLDSIAPVIEDDSNRELKTGGGAGLPKVDDKPKTNDKPKDAPKASNNAGKLEDTKWSSDEVTVQGKTLPKGAIVLEYKKNKTFSQTMTLPDLPQPLTINGTWTLGAADDVLVEVEVPNLGKQKDTIKLSIKDDKLTVTQTAGMIAFTKVK